MKNKSKTEYHAQQNNDIHDDENDNDITIANG